MPGLGPGIHEFVSREPKTWMAGTSPAMTTEREYLGVVASWRFKAHTVA
jgi:hypothetical protein